MVVVCTKAPMLPGLKFPKGMEYGPVVKTQVASTLAVGVKVCVPAANALPANITAPTHAAARTVFFRIVMIFSNNKS